MAYEGWSLAERRTDMLAKSFNYVNQAEYIYRKASPEITRTLCECDIKENWKCGNWQYTYESVGGSVETHGIVYFHAHRHQPGFEESTKEAVSLLLMTPKELRQTETNCPASITILDVLRPKDELEKVLKGLVLPDAELQELLQGVVLVVTNTIDGTVRSFKMNNPICYDNQTLLMTTGYVNLVKSIIDCAHKVGTKDWEALFVDSKLLVVKGCVVCMVVKRRSVETKSSGTEDQLNENMTFLLRNLFNHLLKPKHQKGMLDIAEYFDFCNLTHEQYGSLIFKRHPILLSYESRMNLPAEAFLLLDMFENKRSKGVEYDSNVTAYMTTKEIGLRPQDVYDTTTWKDRAEKNPFAYEILNPKNGKIKTSCQRSYFGELQFLRHASTHINSSGSKIVNLCVVALGFIKVFRCGYLLRVFHGSLYLYDADGEAIKRPNRPHIHNK